MNISKETMAATGFPGTPKTSVPSRTPKDSGLPGFIATRQNLLSTPNSSCTSLTKSYSPTETPPEVMSTSYSRPSPTCLLYTSDAADDLLCVDLGGRRIIKKKKKTKNNNQLTN